MPRTCTRQWGKKIIKKWNKDISQCLRNKDISQCLELVLGNEEKKS